MVSPITATEQGSRVAQPPRSGSLEACVSGGYFEPPGEQTDTARAVPLGEQSDPARTLGEAECINALFTQSIGFKADGALIHW